MSTAQTLEEIKSYPTTELQSLEDSIRLERLRRTRHGLSAQETRLFEIINEPMPGGERYRELTPSQRIYSGRAAKTGSHQSARVLRVLSLSR